ncbi:MAG: right-handed parallel beta-helix repeat-containing protein [Burkholderiales bacterium]|nr:right-handed parallel beta-helix repeat-containing protein [Burkholderiales bacterium]
MNGEINCLDPAGFGAVTITKSMVIDCRSSIGGVLNAGVSGIIVNAAGGQVVLRALDINGTGSGVAGIRILAAASVQVDDSTIRGNTGSGIEFLPSANSQLTVTRTLIRDNAQHGIVVTPTGGASASVAVFDSTLVSNVLTGIVVNDNGFAAVTNTIVSGNGTHGIAARATSSYARISLDRVTSSSNGTSGVLSSGPGGAVYLSNVLTTGNPYGLYPPIGGASYYSFGNNRTGGNTTSDTATNTVIPQY